MMAAASSPPSPSSASIRVTLNGEAQELAAPCTLAELLAARGVGPERSGVAVALDGRVVPRAQWAHTPLSGGEQVEVVTARQGG